MNIYSHIQEDHIMLTVCHPHWNKTGTKHFLLHNMNFLEKPEGLHSIVFGELGQRSANDILGYMKPPLETQKCCGYKSYRKKKRNV